jgi:signal transduction histidine kinase
MPDPNSSRGSVRWETFGSGPSQKSAFKILTVDDNEALRYSLVRCLRDAGYYTLEAKTGEEALALAANQPDLITLDVNLPGMSGFEVCRKLKSDPATAHIPVLHISATCIDPESRVRGLAGGADAYLAEPIDRGELVATVGALLRLKNAEMLAREEAEAAKTARQELAELNATLENRVIERTAELKRTNDSFRELSARLLQMQDEERKRLARELHDGIGQLLVAMTMNNAAIEEEAGKLSPSAKKALEENESMAQEVLRSIRTISHLLHPPLLDEAGLPSALQWYVEEFSHRSGIQVVLNCATSLERLAPDVETAIFRIVQECLGNVHRHSGSPRASIEVDVKDGTASVAISDEGKGIPPSKQQEIESNARGGVGIRGMRERIAQFGGSMQIQSDSKGTKVSVLMPCRHANSKVGSEVA